MSPELVVVALIVRLCEDNGVGAASGVKKNSEGLGLEPRLGLDRSVLS